MYETHLSLIGYLISDVKFALSKRPEGEEDLSVAKFRVASTTRKFDKTQEIWVNGDTTYATIVCFRRLAEHVSTSFKRGDPVIVFGKMRLRQWQGENRSGTELEIIATAVGHNLVFGTSMFSKSLFRVPPDAADSGGPAWPAGPAGESGSEDLFAQAAAPEAGDPDAASPLAAVTPLPGVSDIRSVGTADAPGVLPTRPGEEGTSPHPPSSPSAAADEQAA